MKYQKLIFGHEGNNSLKHFKSTPEHIFKDKEEAQLHLHKSLDELIELQDMFYADCKYSVLIILQSLDAGGKDSVIKHVMSGVNPIGCQVTCFPIKSFKSLSALELEHDYLFRFHEKIPTKGHIGIFNRSYYEEVLVARVHPEIILKEKLPGLNEATIKKEAFWNQRHEEINCFEKYMVNNGIIVLKFFLNLSPDEQRDRLLERINNPQKNWKFGMDDLIERTYWDEYQKIYEQIFQHTSTEHAPWYIIPADKKWHMHAMISEIIVSKLKELNLSYPEVTPQQKKEILEAKKILEKQ